MSYRQPAFMTDNLIGDIGDVVNDVDEAAATSTINNGNRRAFVDGRISSLGTWSATGADSGVRFDLGAVPATEPNRLIIPTTHSGLDGETLEVSHDTAFAFPSPTTVSTAVVSGGGTIDRTLSSGTERYWAVTVSTSVNLDTFIVRGFWLGEYNQLSASAAVDPGFELAWEPQQTESEYPGGVAVAQISPPRRTFSLEVLNVDPAGADYAVLDAVMQKLAKPFWYWPPDDTDPGPFYVRHDRRPRRVQDFGSPSVAVRYKFEFDLIEDSL